MNSNSYDYELKFDPADYYLYEGNFLTSENELDKLNSQKEQDPTLTTFINELIDYIEYVKLIRNIANEILIAKNNNERENAILNESGNIDIESIYDKFFPYEKRNNEVEEANYNLAFFEAMALIINKDNVVDINKLALPEYVRMQEQLRREFDMSDEEFIEYKKHYNMPF